MVHIRLSEVGAMGDFMGFLCGGNGFQDFLNALENAVEIQTGKGLGL